MEMGYFSAQAFPSRTPLTFVSWLKCGQPRSMTGRFFSWFSGPEEKKRKQTTQSSSVRDLHESRSSYHHRETLIRISGGGHGRKQGTHGKMVSSTHASEECRRATNLADSSIPGANFDPEGRVGSALSWWTWAVSLAPFAHAHERPRLLDRSSRTMRSCDLPFFGLSSICISSSQPTFRAHHWQGLHEKKSDSPPILAERWSLYSGSYIVRPQLFALAVGFVGGDVSYFCWSVDRGLPSAVVSSPTVLRSRPKPIVG
ncbi:hypothetical protein QBC47DRAFT_90531 [Echria macrotheca]|uniref:Uncharacterized protein n=1 Tax=Echria macrotheca TaxID=438768 RepID=A0AAJ0F4R9_9PEZI|nr:hypothetical protein QBC47DRAFT_90531 [Echria macrotheca]